MLWLNISNTFLLFLITVITPICADDDTVLESSFHIRPSSTRNFSRQILPGDGHLGELCLPCGFQVKYLHLVCVTLFPPNSSWWRTSKELHLPRGLQVYLFTPHPRGLFPPNSSWRQKSWRASSPMWPLGINIYNSSTWHFSRQILPGNGHLGKIRLPCGLQL